MNVSPWTPEYELNYHRRAGLESILRRHADHATTFGLLDIIRELPEPATVMEVGCGAAGGLLRYIPYKHRRIAVDPLIHDYPWLLEGWELRSEYCHELQQPDDSVDLLICLETLDHCESYDQFRDSQRQLARVLKPGGTLLFMTPARAKPADGHPVNPCGNEIHQWFKECGLEIVKTDFQREGTWMRITKRIESENRE